MAEDRELAELQRLLPGALATAAAASEPEWMAVMVSQDAFVMDDDDVRGWAEAAAAGKHYWQTDAEPRRIEIVTGSARPVPQSDRPDEEFYRVPSSWQIADKFVVIDDLDELQPAEVLRLWDLALAAARGINAGPSL